MEKRVEILVIDDDVGLASNLEISWRRKARLLGLLMMARLPSPSAVRSCLTWRLSISGCSYHR